MAKPKSSGIATEGQAITKAVNVLGRESESSQAPIWLARLRPRPSCAVHVQAIIGLTVKMARVSGMDAAAMEVPKKPPVWHRLAQITGSSYHLTASLMPSDVLCSNAKAQMHLM